MKLILQQVALAKATTIHELGRKPLLSKEGRRIATVHSFPEGPGAGLYSRYCRCTQFAARYHLSCNMSTASVIPRDVHHTPDTPSIKREPTSSASSVWSQASQLTRAQEEMPCCGLAAPGCCPLNPVELSLSDIFPADGRPIPRSGSERIVSGTFSARATLVTHELKPLRPTRSTRYRRDAPPPSHRSPRAKYWKLTRLLQSYGHYDAGEESGHSSHDTSDLPRSVCRSLCNDTLYHPSALHVRLAPKSNPSWQNAEVKQEDDSDDGSGLASDVKCEGYGPMRGQRVVLFPTSSRRGPVILEPVEPVEASTDQFEFWSARRLTSNGLLARKLRNASNRLRERRDNVNYMSTLRSRASRA